MNFRKPSKVQEKTLPLLLMDPPQNLIGQSQSGTGKTAAFVLNILRRLDLSSEQAQKTPQALVLAPSRELARQIQGVVKVMGSFVQGLNVEAAVPTDAASRARAIEASVVVGTPGTVMDMIRKRSMDPRNLRVLVLDEADNMLDQQGLGDQCIRVKKCEYDPPRWRFTDSLQATPSKRPNRSLLSYLPRSSGQICSSIRTKC